MRIIIKRIAAAFLILNMLLAGLTSCAKTPFEKAEDLLIEESKNDLSANVKKILYIHCRTSNRKKYVRLLAYAPSNDAKYYKLEYSVSEKDYDKLTDLLKDNEQIYPFSQEQVQQLTHIVKSYDPTVEKNPLLKDGGDEMFDQLVEEYCK